MNKLNVAVIGTGFGEIVHIPAFLLNKHYNLIGIYGRNYEKTKKIADKYSIKAYKSKQEIIDDSSINLVSISSIVLEHYNDIKLFIDNKKNLILEKPISMNYNQAVELAQLCKVNGNNTAICHEHKYDPSWQWCKEILQTEKYGKIRSIYFDYRFTYWNSLNSQRPFDWFSEKEYGGGLAGGHLSHILDLINFIDSTGTKSVIGRGLIEVPYHYDSHGEIKKQTAEDTISGTIFMNSGTIVYINISAARFERKKTVCFYCEHAKIVLKAPDIIEIYDTNGELIENNIPEEFKITDFHKDFRLNSFVVFLNDFYGKYFEDKKSCITDFESECNIQKILDLFKV